MPHKKSFFTTLKGFGTFSRVMLNGRRFEKYPIKAFTYISKAEKSSVQIGFTTSKTIKRATERNRLKRLMKEAVRKKATFFIGQNFIGKKIELLLMYNRNPNAIAKRIKFSEIEQAVNEICSLITKYA